MGREGNRHLGTLSSVVHRLYKFHIGNTRRQLVDQHDPQVLARRAKCLFLFYIYTHTNARDIVLPCGPSPSANFLHLSRVRFGLQAQGSLSL